MHFKARHTECSLLIIISTSYFSIFAYLRTRGFNFWSAWLSLDAEVDTIVIYIFKAAWNREILRLNQIVRIWPNVLVWGVTFAEIQWISIIFNNIIYLKNACFFSLFSTGCSSPAALPPASGRTEALVRWHCVVGIDKALLALSISFVSRAEGASSIIDFVVGARASLPM